VLALVLGLAAGLTYGVADFTGGLASRKAPLVTVLLVSQLFGTLLLLAALPFMTVGTPGSSALGWGAAAGLAGAGGVTLLYRGLSRGRMSVVAPVTSVNAASIPVIYGLIIGERPGPIALIGVAIALVAIAFVSRSGEVPEEGRTRLRDDAALLDAIGAGTCFGLFFIFLSFAPADSSMWPLVGARVASLICFVVAALATRSSMRPPTGAIGIVAAAGVLDVAANLLYLLATREGLLSLVAVLTSLYPAATVILARVVLRERLVRIQLVGLALAGTGVVLIALR
jgi:drug/metabolite transporter (DMT)-like permease